MRIHAEKTSTAGAGSVVDSSNVTCTLTFSDGSVASVLYTTMGSRTFPKERVELFFDGRVVVLDDFTTLQVAQPGHLGKPRHSKQDKGHYQLLDEYGKYLRGESEGADLPTLCDGVRATVCSLKVLDALRTGVTQEFRAGWPSQ